MKHDPDPRLYRLYHQRWMRSRELCDALLKAVERIADGKEHKPMTAAEMALEEYEAIDARHFEEDQQEEREYYAAEAADARRKEMMMEDSA